MKKFILILFLFISVIGGAQQFARPNSDISIGGWTDDAGGTTNIYTVIDDNTTTEYIEALNGTNTTGQFGTTNVDDPGVGTGHIIRFSMQGTGNGAPERCRVQLYQGGTQIADTGNFTNRGSWGTKSYTLSEAEANSITDYTDLRFYVISSNLGGTEDMWVAWVELEVPEASSGRRIFITN